MTKVNLATLMCFYPAALAALMTLGSFVDPSLGIALASLLLFKTSISIALILSTLLGLFAKDYPKIY
jgi:antibiotic biosynthesis monooxygenase (ABM) superfamily enzyme